MVDDLLPTKGKGVGRPSLLSDSEIITILIWNMLTMNSKTLKGVWKQLRMYHKHDFPKTLSYQTFVRRAHSCLPHLISIFETVLADTAPTRILDSTMLPVCKPARADDHKVAKSIAFFRKELARMALWFQAPCKHRLEW